MLEDIRAYVAKWLPAYISDNRSYFTVALGCTGGQHRSVYCTETLAERLMTKYPEVKFNVEHLASPPVPLSNLERGNRGLGVKEVR